VSTTLPGRAPMPAPLHMPLFLIVLGCEAARAFHMIPKPLSFDIGMKTMERSTTRARQWRVLPVLSAAGGDDEPSADLEAVQRTRDRLAARIDPYRDELAPRGNRRSRHRMPGGARSRLSRTDAGTLLVEIPGESLVSSSALFGGAFSIAWFSAIGSFTASALATASLGAALFSAPFWFAGAAVVRQTILDPTRRASLELGDYAWSLRSEAALGLAARDESGDAEDVEGAYLLRAPVDAQLAADYSRSLTDSRGTSRAREAPAVALLLVVGAQEFVLGQGLAPAELEWLCEEINVHLQELNARRRVGSTNAGAQGPWGKEGA